MKKLFGILLAVVMVFSVVFALAACTPKETYEIAMVTDVGDITDQSFNQTTWEAVKDWSIANNKTYSYYRPADDTNEDRIAKIEEAIGKGAKIVVCPGYLFETAVFEVQDQYPEVKFVLLDGVPNNGLYDDLKVSKTSTNSYSVVFKEEQAGYLAGYAAVKDGERNLGYMGGMAVPAVVRFGYGYIQGIQAAAKELDVNVNVWYGYGNQFFGSPEITAVTDTWVTAGCKTIFACGGGIFTSAVESLEKTTGGKLIGVDTDQSLTISSSKITVLTSAVKGLYDSTQKALTAYAEGKWSTLGGKEDNLGISAGDNNNYVGIPTATTSWKFANYKLADYNTLVAAIRAGSVSIDNNIAVVVADWCTAASNITLKDYNGGIVPLS